MTLQEPDAPRLLVIDADRQRGTLAVLFATPQRPGEMVLEVFLSRRGRRKGLDWKPSSGNLKDENS